MHVDFLIASTNRFDSVFSVMLAEFFRFSNRRECSLKYLPNTLILIEVRINSTEINKKLLWLRWKSHLKEIRVNIFTMQIMTIALSRESFAILHKREKSNREKTSHSLFLINEIQMIWIIIELNNSFILHELIATDSTLS